MTTIAIQPKKRIDSIDVLRGIVMVIMALDHTRDFFSNITYDPTDLTKASTALFLTRFITHFCAATFVFLAGTSAFLYLSRGKTKKEASIFLLTRGIWLIILEITVIRIGWDMVLNFNFITLQVIWAIGVSMVVLSVLIYLPVRVIGAFGLLLIFGHDLLDKIGPEYFNHTGAIIWEFLHVQSTLSFGGHYQVLIYYPLIPWIGVMAVGYSFGTIFKLESGKRRKSLLILGFSAIALFVIIRAFNIYGDPGIWTTQGAWYRTVLSFIDIHKYPPSLDYLLITLGPALLLLSVLEKAQNKLTDIFVIYGRVPMFYYILHLYLLHITAIVVTIICAHTGITFGFGLPVVYFVWISVVITLYFPCRWYMNYKRTHKYWWLGYI